MSERQELSKSLSESHELITTERDTGNAFYMVGRQYPTGDVELTAIKLSSDDQLRRGGGAKRKNKNKTLMTETVLAKSRQRAKTTIRRKLLSIRADRMLTLTFRENVTDIDQAWEVFKYFNKLMRFRFPAHAKPTSSTNLSERKPRESKSGWSYVAVPEYQERGAVHFHLGISGFYPVGTVRRLWRRACGQLQGNIDITDPRKFNKKSWNPKRISNYLSKYVSKNDSVEFNKRRYSSGGEIPVPEPVNGWLALGVPVVKVMREVIESATRKPLARVIEIEGYYDMHVLTT